MPQKTRADVAWVSCLRPRPRKYARKVPRFALDVPCGRERLRVGKDAAHDLPGLLQHDPIDGYIKLRLEVPFGSRAPPQ